jgi:hypothetical protein
MAELRTVATWHSRLARFCGASSVLLLLLLAACGSAAPTSSTGTAANPGLTVGQSVPYSLYTHCGVLSLNANGHIYYAQPPLGDGSGNPPGGWANPYDAGTLTMVDAHNMAFHDPAGNKATFTDTPAGATPIIPMCS